MCWECKPKIELTIMSAAEAQSPLWFISHWCGPCASSVVRVFCCGPGQYGVARLLLVLWARPLWFGPAVTGFVRRVWPAVRHLARVTRERCLVAPMIASVHGRAEHKWALYHSFD